MLNSGCATFAVASIAPLTTSIAGYETEVGLFGYRELITRGAFDIAQPDLVWSGGFTECRKIAALHFAASSPNVLMVEWDQTEHGLRTELLNEPFDYDGGGMMRVPEGPGLGVTLNRDTLEKYRVR